MGKMFARMRSANGELKENKEGDDRMKTNTETVKCGNCQYWTGAREPVFDAKGIPKVDITDDVGNCENEGSRFCRQMRKKSASCKDFSKWTELF